MAEEGTHQSGVLRELLAVFSFGVETKELKEGESALNEFFHHVKEIAEAVAAVFAVDAIYEFVESNVKAMTAIERTATQLGISTDEVQSYQFAAKSLGMEQDQLLNSMGRLQIAQQAAADGAKQQTKAFADLKVKIKDNNGEFKEADQLFIDVADAISDVKDPSKQAALAVHLFGRAGRTLLPILKEGADGIDELIEAFHDMGGGYTEAAIEKAKDFERQSARLSTGLIGLKNVITKSLLPPVTWAVEKLADAVKWLRSMTSESYIVESALGLMGAAAGVFAIRMAIANAPILLMAGSLALLVVAVDDIVTMFAGGESVIGDTIDKIFGKGAHVQYVQDVRDAYRDIAAYLKEAYGYVEKVMGNVFGDREETGRTSSGAVTQRNARGQEAIVGGNPEALPFGEKGATHLSFPARVDKFFGWGPFAGGIPSMSPPAAAMGPGAGDPNMHQLGPVIVNVTAPPGNDSKEHGRVIADHVTAAMKQERREAAAQLQRKAP